MEEELEPDSPTEKLHIITIMLAEYSSAPLVDIGDVPPHAAICFFRQAAETLESLLHPPSITYDGEIIYQVTESDD